MCLLTYMCADVIFTMTNSLICQMAWVEHIFKKIFITGSTFIKKVLQKFSKRYDALRQEI